MPAHAAAAMGVYVAASSTPLLMPHAIAKVKQAVPVVSGLGKRLASVSDARQKPSEPWSGASAAAMRRRRPASSTA